MTTWVPINTSTYIPVVYEFNSYATLSFAEGTFVDGAPGYDQWNTIGTAQSPNWGVISTSSLSSYGFNTYAALSFAEGAFADGAVYEPWTLISTS
jgi:hypothetical protein